MSTTAVKRFVRVFGGQLSGGGLQPITIGPEPLVVGRGEGCGIRLNDPKVRALHFEICATPRGVHIRDHDSTNGTWVNGDEIEGMYLHHPGEIRAGDTKFRFTPGHGVDLDRGSSEPCGDLVGTSDPMKELYQRIRQVASSEYDALIEGETGTGKELVANAIHRLSSRAAAPILVIDCGAIPRELAESVLFGHERGAFTGATERRLSPFVAAEGGTVFLDEIGELPLELHTRLLRVLEQRQVMAIGATSYRPVNVRIIAATRRNLEKEVNDGRFRSDLYFRLRVLRVVVPALRKHREDIPELTEYLARALGRGGVVFTPDSFRRMAEHDWPGNVRELRNLIAEACTFAPPQGPIDAGQYLLPASRRTAAGPTRNFFAARDEFERAFWQGEVVRGRSIAEIARVTGVERATVRSYARRFGLRKDED